MSRSIVLVFALALTARVVSVVISIRHERRLKRDGAIEFGTRNTRVLSILHLLIYVLSMVEAAARQTTWGPLAFWGSCLLGFSLAMLGVVIYQLSPIWTVKLIIAPKHPINRSFLFRSIRHPNYFLNIVPELLGLALLTQAWWTFAVMTPPYMVSLATRILQEERVMSEL